MPNPTDENDLRELLESRGLDLETWGVDGAKSLRDLWHEIVEGVTEIKLNPLTRHISVVEVAIRRGNLLLIEIEQEMADGQFRDRRTLPSEKIRPNEPIEEAALRCLKEELNIDPGVVTLAASVPQVREKLLESLSYPGLPTAYVFHRVDAEVPDLPGGSFWTDEGGNGDLDPVRRHHWEWRGDGPTE